MCVQDVRIAKQTDKTTVSVLNNGVNSLSMKPRGNRLSLILAMADAASTNGAGGMIDNVCNVILDGIHVATLSNAQPSLVLTYQQLGVLLYGAVTSTGLNRDGDARTVTATEVFLTTSLKVIEESHEG